MKVEQEIIELADALMEKYDPCQLKDGGCLVRNPSPCCDITRFGRRCKYSKNNRCTNPNVECKIWFCETAIKNMDPKVYEAFRGLEHIARQFDMTNQPFLGDTNYVGADKP